MSAAATDHPASVLIWIARASPALATAFAPALPPPLLAECERFSAAERDRRIVRAALRRTVLAPLLGVAASELHLPRSPGGRPLPPPGLGGSLSASHHDDLTALAYSALPRLGLDLEPRAEADWDAALDAVLTGAERRQLAALAPPLRPAAYFRLWTLKEAVMKALGEGLSQRAPDSVEIVLGRRPLLARIDGGPPTEPWVLHSAELCGHHISLAVPAAVAIEVELRRWPRCLEQGASASLSENTTIEGRKSR